MSAMAALLIGIWIGFFVGLMVVALHSDRR